MSTRLCGWYSRDDGETKCGLPVQYQLVYCNVSSGEEWCRNWACHECMVREKKSDKDWTAYIVVIPLFKIPQNVTRHLYDIAHSYDEDEVWRDLWKAAVHIDRECWARAAA